MSEVKKVFGRARGLVTTFVNAFVPNYEDKSTEVYKYGKDNLLPNQLISFVADSGVATRAVNKFAEYLASDGFTEESSSDFKVNDFQTADQLLQEASQYMGYLTAVAFHVSRKGGKVSSIKVMPTQCVRKRFDGSFLYNETLGQPKYEGSKDKIYPKYAGAELPLSLLSDPRYKNGEILYVYRKTPLNAHYGVPDYYAQIEDVRTSTQLCKMDLELAVNGFMPSAIITVVGDIDGETKDKDGKTEVDYYREDFEAFTSKSEATTGGRFKALLQFAKTKDEATVISTFDAKPILDASNTKRDVVERSVCRLFGVHPVLLGYSDAAILGNTQALANASLELNKVVNPYQRMITEAFEMLFPEMDWTISEYMPINYIDPALFDKMTEDEIRNKLLGLPPREVMVKSESAQTLEALNSISPLVANEVMKSLTVDEIRGLVGLAPIKEKTTTTNGAVN